MLTQPLPAPYDSSDCRTAIGASVGKDAQGQRIKMITSGCA